MTNSTRDYDTLIDDNSTRARGNLAERKAVEHLLGKGYSIITCNYRSRAGEIDIIAHDSDGTLVFVEVKSARSKACGNPLSWVTPAKQKTIIKMAKLYLAEHKITSSKCRFDVIGIVGNTLDHLKNAFLAG